MPKKPKLTPNQMLGAMLFAQPFIQPLLERTMIEAIVDEHLAKARIIIPEKAQSKKKSKGKSKRL